ncbi:hypothetical protein HDU79_002247 [Rhizoclosmatium sp. JEL0117]|nr:hypothetical protein HDU79_002247 [Rhizoclosmatium sp. JEL0117]
MGGMTHSGRDFLSQEKQLFEKKAALIKPSNHVRAIRVKLITSLFVSCNIYSTESLDVENALDQQRDTLPKKDIGKAAGMLYPILGGSVSEASNDLPPYK